MDVLTKSLERIHGKDAVADMQFDLAGSLELAAVREAGALDLIKTVKHPRTGQSFMDALEDFAGREETIKMKGYKSKERKALHEKILRDLNEEQGGKFEAGKTIEIVLGPPGAANHPFW